MTSQSPDSPSEVLPAQTSRSEAQRTYGRLSRFRSSILGLPVEIVMGQKPAASSA